MSYNVNWNKWIIASVTKHFRAAIALGVQANTVAAAVDNSGGYAVGSKIITIDGTTGDSIAVGQWCTIAGDAQPSQIVAVSGTPVTQITLASGLDNAQLTEVYLLKEHQTAISLNLSTWKFVLTVRILKNVVRMTLN